MQPKLISLSLSLLLAGALAVMAQSPTSSAPPGQSTTKDPYGATLDHPNPNSGAAASTASAQSTAPATTTSTTTTTTSSTDDTATTPATPSSTMPADTATGTDQNGSAATASTSNTLPRTASNLPMIGALGLLALGGALTLRSAAKRA